MNLPKSGMQAVIDGKRYNTKTADEIANDVYWDGHNMERGGTNRFLFRTKNGRYFAACLTQWQGASDHIEPYEQDEAVAFWEECARAGGECADFETAFPDIQLEDA